MFEVKKEANVGGSEWAGRKRKISDVEEPDQVELQKAWKGLLFNERNKFEPYPSVPMQIMQEVEGRRVE